VIEWRESSPLLTNDGELFVSEGAGILKIKSILLSIMAIGLGIMIWGRGTVAQAESLSVPKSTAPQGLTIDSYFETTQVFDNSAKPVDTNKGKNQAVLLTDGARELGTIWTSNAAKMNMAEDQKASMWMYFGDGYNAGDGMAFVIQNGDVDAAAIDNSDPANPIAARGETLGVWGHDTNNQATTPQQVADTAIPKSWALEFDTFNNRLPTGSQAPTSDQAWDSDYFSKPTSAANQFDEDTPGGYAHIASNYPGEASTYNIMTKNLSWTSGGFLGLGGTTTTKSYNYATMNHLGIISNNFSLLRNDNGAWKHLTLNWKAPAAGLTTGTMTYTFNDKDPKTGAKLTSGVSSRSVPINLTKLGLSADDARVRWGFTGSTGDSFENNLVVFEEVPGLVDADVTANLVDNSQANMTIDDASDKVYTGDQMTLKYHLNYKGGRDSWQSIKNKLNLPADIAYDSAKVTYDDGKFADGKTSETIPVDSNDTTGQSVSETLARNLSKNTSAGETDGATITLTGKVSSKTATAGTPDKVASKTSSFEGSNAITQATVSGFQVLPGGDGTSVMTMALTGPEKNIVANSNNQKGSETQTSATDVTVSGKITYKKVDGTPVTGKTLTLQPRLNGNSLQTKTVTDSDGDGIYDFSYMIPSTSLIAGSTGNVLDLFATDTSTHLSAANNLEYTVTLKDGTKSISANTLSSFNADNPQKMTGAAMRLTPDSNWSVKVYDSIGTGDQWTLQAEAEPLKTRLSVPLDGDLKYLDGSGNENSLTQGVVNIASHTTTSDDDVVDVAKSWDQKHGIVLDVNGGAVQGNYSTQIQWTFYNGPK